MKVKEHEDFRTGFITGYRSVRGGNVLVPVVPATPLIPESVSAFRLGLNRGIRAAEV